MSERITCEEAYDRYDYWLNESYPLNGMVCNPFCLLLKTGDNMAYELGFDDFLDARDIEIIEIDDE